MKGRDPGQRVHALGEGMLHVIGPADEDLPHQVRIRVCQLEGDEPAHGEPHSVGLRAMRVVLDQLRAGSRSMADG